MVAITTYLQYKQWQKKEKKHILWSQWFFELTLALPSSNSVL